MPADRRVRSFRCESCGDLLSSRHPWDEASCGCGRLTVTGGPRRSKVRWIGGPGGGWSEVDDEVDVEGAPADARPLGYLAGRSSG